MKTAVFLAACLATASAFAQSGARPTKFAGVGWGSPPEAAAGVLKQREDVTMEDEVDSGAEKIVATGGVFAGREVSSWTLEFVEGKLASGAVIFKTEGNAMTVYREMKQMLASKYGPSVGEKRITPTKTNRRMRDASGERRAYAGTVATWKFAPTISDKDALSISCEVAGPDGAVADDESELLVTLRYTDDTLYAPALKAAKTPEKPAKTTERTPAKPRKKEDL